MRIIQSFWTRNSFNLEQLKGSWLDHAFSLMSWALSNHTISQFYDIELYTDDFGYEILVKRLGLKYSKVHLIFNDYDYPFSNKLWCFNKLHTYSLQESAFLHIDGDVFIWKPFSDKLLQAPLIAQNLERNLPNYLECSAAMKVHFKYIPSYFDQLQFGSNALLASNAGIFGGNRYDFFKELKEEAFKLLDQNRSYFDSVPVGYMNIMSEQYIFDLLAEQQEIPISYLLDEVAEPPHYIELNLFSSVPQYVQYIHIMGAKKNPVTCHQLALTLFKENKFLYQKCLDTSGELSQINNLNKPVRFAPSQKQLSFFKRTMYFLKSSNIKTVRKRKYKSIKQLEKTIESIENVDYHFFYLIADLFNFEYRRKNAIENFSSSSITDYIDLISKTTIITNSTEFRLNKNFPIIESYYDWTEENEFQNSPFDEKIKINLKAQPYAQFTILRFDYHTGVFYEQHLDILNACIVEFALENSRFTSPNFFQYIKKIFEPKVLVSSNITLEKIEQYLGDMLFIGLLIV